jgi:ABC-type transport system involved in multi-copper enzyme maturation permease subunit
MIWNIARKEIVSNLLSYKFFIVIILTVVLVFTSFFIMHKDFKERLSDYQLIRPGTDEPIAVLPPNSLSIFAKGLDDAIGRSFEISPIGITVRAGQKSGNIVFSFFPTPDFLYVVKVVLSLVALLFGFDQVSREREQGTLKLMLSNHVSRARVLAGKWIGNILSLAIPFLLVVLLGITLLNFDPDISFSSNQLARLAFILFLTVLYIALFLSLGMLISTLTRKTASSVVALLFSWTLLVFIFPNIGTLLARQMVDVPSVLALNEKRDQIWTREILLGLQDRDLRAHYSQINTEQEQLEEDYRNRFNRLVRLSKSINRISPVASYVYAATDLAGTGIGEEESMKKSVISYKNAILPDISSAVLDRTEVQYPAFEYRYKSVSEVLAGGTLFDTAWLIFFNILFFTLSYTALVRYDVR